MLATFLLFAVLFGRHTYQKIAIVERVRSIAKMEKSQKYPRTIGNGPHIPPFHFGSKTILVISIRDHKYSST